MNSKGEKSNKLFKRIRLVAREGEVARSTAISAVAIALGVYAMVLQAHNSGIVVLAAIVLLISAGAMLQVGRGVRQLHRKHLDTHESALRAEHHYFKVLRRIVSAIENRDPYTRGRSKRIGYLARRIGEKIGLDDYKCRMLDLAGQVHDIGLLSVPEYILNKPSRLGNDEFRTVKKHAEMSYRILEPLTFLTEILPAIRHHHERMNGTGYPNELQFENIPVTARILAVSDAYDAMTHDRPHRPALSTIEALNELKRCSPAGYDEKCVVALEEVLNMKHLRKVNQTAKSLAPSH
ncbi:MAG: HD domain-containing phosphohydrolase [Planctomycetota bacterium]|nr:HD domain-containing phosphohydrolase [Planctomycetota bacterium]